MEIEDFPNNSVKNRSRDYTKPAKTSKEEAPEETPEVRVEKVITGKIVRREKSFGSRVKDTFFAGEDAKTVLGGVFADTIVPGLRDLIWQGGSHAMERAIFGNVNPAARRAISGVARRGAEAMVVNYNKVSTAAARRDDPRIGASKDVRRNHDFAQLVIESRVEAEEVLTRMYELLERYHEVKVSDLYNMLDITPDHPDFKWGWVSLAGSEVQRARGGGYVLVLPRTEVLD